jgi:essential nuclear protein 1
LLGTCTLREANIVAAVLTRTSIPVLHSAAAIKGLCDISAEQSSDRTEAAAATNTLLKALLEKGYALPWQVVDSLFFFFTRTAAAAQTSNQILPVIWQKNLLIFAERYRNDITEDQREALLDVLLAVGHAAMAPEIRKELLAGRGRGVALEQQGPDIDDDDTMLVDP